MAAIIAPICDAKSVSEHDIEEDIRLSAKAEEIAKIKRARLERSGDLKTKTVRLPKGADTCRGSA